MAKMLPKYRKRRLSTAPDRHVGTPVATNVGAAVYFARKGNCSAAARHLQLGHDDDRATAREKKALKAAGAFVAARCAPSLGRSRRRRRRR